MSMAVAMSLDVRSIATFGEADSQGLLSKGAATPGSAPRAGIGVFFC
jgi:hypothetical protein